VKKLGYIFFINFLKLIFKIKELNKLLFCWQGVLIGKQTNKIIFVGTRNRYCYICAVALKNKKDPQSHICHKDFDGPSTGMEQEIIVEGFKTVYEEHKVLINEYLGDGDSSTMARIRERCSFGYRVKKIPCKNHAVRVYVHHLYGLANNTKAFKDVAPRNTLKSSIPRLAKMANCAIAEATKDTSTPKEEKVKKLRESLQNGPRHVFGDHSKCPAWCKPRPDVNKVNFLQEAKLWGEIENRNNYLVSLAENLRSDLNTNSAESFMAVNNKMQGSKRVNQANRGAFKGRTNAAALKFNYKHKWSYFLWKERPGRLPYKALVSVVQSRDRSAILNRAAQKRRMELNPEERARKRGRKDEAGGELEYGPNAAQPDITDTEMARRKEKRGEFLKNSIDSPEKIKNLCNDTKGQFGGPNKERYEKEKRYRVTASHFGKIVKMRASTHPHGMVKSITVPVEISNLLPVDYGIRNEACAKRRYEEEYGEKAEVRDNGLETNISYPFLGASPDGFVGENGIIEVKCFLCVGQDKIKAYVANLQGLDSKGEPIYIDGERKARSKKFSAFCLEIDEKSKRKDLHLKKTSNYYYQVQGQLAITEKQFCDFIVYTEKDFFIERFTLDKDLWENVMLPKLTWFYEECLLPELLDSRIQRGMKVRTPEKAWIDAKPNRKKATKKKLDF